LKVAKTHLGQDDDPTEGYVDYIDLETALDNGIVVKGDQAYMGVDHTTDLTDSSARGRQSVRIQSKNTYNHGLFIADIEHMPGGVCGTWPALYDTLYASSYPC
jgi:hypothetical protein